MWEELYRDAKKAEKLKSEANERDEGELERTGQPLCIYEVYNGAGAWPFLHHGSLYRGLSLVSYSTILIECNDAFFPLFGYLCMISCSSSSALSTLIHAFNFVRSLVYKIAKIEIR